MNLTRVFDILSFQIERYPNTNALVHWRNDTWKNYAIQDCQKIVNAYSRMLLNLGVQKGDLVLFIPELATLEWVLLDFAIQQIGAVDVPIHVSFQKEHFDYIRNETQAKYCIIWNRGTKDKLFPDGEPDDLKLIQITTDRDNHSFTSNLVKEFSKENNEDLEAIKASVQPTDLATIIYTSGTTGTPKGVMLSHENLMANLHSVMPLLPINAKKRVLSFLPWSHIFERSAIYTYMAMGCSVYLLEERSRLKEAFHEVRPHLITCVPRILEKIYDNILMYQAQQNALVKKIISWSLRLAMQYQSGKGFNPFYWLQYQVARFLWARAIHRVFGGRLEAIFVGAAYLQPNLARIFAASGIKVREGYGMTETSPAISLNRFTPGLNKYGTVGIPVPGVEVKIDNNHEDGEGEILVRGKNVMIGYYKQKEETAKVLDEEGWLRTGDIGRWKKHHFLTITDRKKDIFKTSAGKYVAPQPIEHHLCSSDFIDQIMIVGFKRPFLTALILPNFVLLKQWCLENEVHWTSPQYMVLNIKVRQKIETEIEILNEGLSNYEKIRKFHLVFKEWTIEEGLMSYTMKLIRGTIEERYERAIKEMYEGD